MRHLRPASTAISIATLAFASPGLAQDLCGGLGAGGQWIGGSEAASDIATSPGVQEQMALVLGGNEYVSLFSLSDPTEVRIEAQGRGAADPQLDVYDQNGSIVASDDDSGGGGAARAETPLDAGTYCVAVRSYDGSPMTSFVRVARTEQEALTPGIAVETPTDTETEDEDTPALLANASCADARQLEGSLEDGGLSGTASVNETGFWAFTLDAPAPVTLTAENPDADPVMTVFDSTDTYLAENDDYDGLNAQIDFDAPLDAGDYCIQVTAVNDNDLPITTRVTVFDASASLRQQVDAGDMAPPMDGSFAINDLGVLQTRTRVDVTTTPEVQWLQITMPTAGLLLAEAVAVNSGVDTWMVAFDDLGRQVALNDDYGEGFDSLIAARVAAGTYLIGIKQLEDEGTGTARIVLERYIAAQ